MTTPKYITAALLGWLALVMCGLGSSLEQERTARTGAFRITQWNSEEGLPQNTVICLFQTRQGYLWIGTRYGIARYDGVRLADYSPELGEANENQIEVRGMAEDTSGRLWMHGKADMVCFESGVFRKVSPEMVGYTNTIIKISSSRAGGVWVLTEEGFFRLEKPSPSRVLSVWSQVKFPVGQARIADFFEDNATNLWYAADLGPQRSWLRFTPGSARAEYATNIFQQPGFDGGVLRLDHHGTAWLGRTNELLRLDERGQIQRFSAEQAWGKNQVQDIVEDRRGNLWVRTWGPAQLFRFANGQFTRFAAEQGLRHSWDLRCVCPDREGNVWVGSGSGGFYRIQERQLLALVPGLKSSPEEIYSICGGAKERVWMASPHGIIKSEEGALVFYTNSVREPSHIFNRVRPVFEHSSGEVYCGVDFLGLHRLHNGIFQRLSFPAGPPTERRHITSFCEGQDGTLWMATPMGLVERREDNWKLWGKAHGLTDERTFGLVAVPDGAVWVGTKNGGVCRFLNGQFQALRKKDGLLSDNAWPLRWETNGTLWVGTPAGINRIRGSATRSITRREGLVDNLAYCLLDDGRGNYWSFGNRGIWKVAQSDLNLVADGLATHVHAVCYGEADGMPSAEGNGDDQPNAVALENGELWFPTTHGAVIVAPDKLSSNEVQPPVVIEEVLADGRVVYRDGAYPARGTRPRTGNAQSLRLAPGSGRVMEVRYTANVFIDSERTHFRYRLRGDTDEWREAQTRREAFYTGLKPGDYLFEVEARNHHGVWSAHPIQFAFKIEPHFYQTWPFFIGSAIAAMGLLGTLHNRRLNEARRIQELQQERALHEERSRIAKDLHDDLGASLTGLALKVEIARRQMKQPEQVEAHLSSAAETIRSLVDRMREVIWSLNPQCDTLESFRAYCCQYAENFLAATRLRCRFEMPVDLPNLMLSAEERHHLLLVIKEALNNTARHASATEVKIGLRLHQALLVITLADNGCGFDACKNAPPDRAGNGLHNMRKRVELLGGKFELESVIGVGTTIQIVVPLPKTR